MPASAAAQRIIRYVVYNKATGRIIHTHSQTSVVDKEYAEVPVDEVRAMFTTTLDFVRQRHNLAPEDLDVLKVESNDPNAKLGAMMVDPRQLKLVPRPSLALSADKSELTGDGQDSALIEITLTDADGHPADGAVKVTTDRGKLSARGGRVDLVNGRASITLTSANETVSGVRVRADHVDGIFLPAQLDLEFV